MKIRHLLLIAAALAFSLPASAAQITFNGGTATLGDTSTVVTNNSTTQGNVDYYVEDGFKLDFIGSNEYIGNYYGAGNAVIHGHWPGPLSEITITKVGGGAFDLNYFILTSNTISGGAGTTASGTELTYIRAHDGVCSGAGCYTQLLPPENWGFPASQIFLGNEFDAVTSVSFFTTNNVLCFGMDEFYIDEAAPPNPNAVPEPMSAALLGLGLLGFLARRRRAK